MPSDNMVELITVAYNHGVLGIAAAGNDKSMPTPHPAGLVAYLRTVSAEASNVSAAAIWRKIKNLVLRAGDLPICCPSRITALGEKHADLVVRCTRK